MKERWVNEMIQEQFNNQQLLRDKFGVMSGVEAVEGKYYLYGLNTLRNFGGGSRAEGDTLPTAGRQGYAQAKLYKASQFHLFGISGDAISSSARGGATGGALLAREMSGVIRDAKKERERIMFGDGSGLLAKVATVTSTTVFTVSTTSQQLGMKYMQVGRVVDILVMTTGATTNGVLGATITAVTGSTATVTIGTACAGTIDTTYGVYVSGARNKEEHGLRAIVDNVDPGLNTIYGQGVIAGVGASTTTGVTSPGYQYGGIARATAGNEYWQANVFANGGVLRDLAPDLMQQAFMRGEEITGRPCDFIVGSYGCWRAYGNAFLGARRWEGNVQKMDGGYKSLPFNGVPFYYCVDCPPNTIYFLNTDTCDILEEEPLGIANEDGLTMIRSSTTDDYTGRMVRRGQMGCNEPAALTVLTDITEN